MTRKPRIILALAAVLLSAPALSQANFPERPIRFIVSFPPGGSSDLVAGAMARVIKPAGVKPNEPPQISSKRPPRPLPEAKRAAPAAPSARNAGAPLSHS